jgi:NADPH:quinone reductase-like Zn-dependent oxidoreductase
MRTMLTERYLGPHQIELREVSMPEIGEGEALVQVRACGFCGSGIDAACLGYTHL